MINLVLGLLILSSVNLVSAQDAEVSPFKGESEASVVIVEGNSSSRTHSAKTKNEYKIGDVNLITGSGSILQTSALGVETANSWSAALRYDYIFTKDVFNLFLQRKAEGDVYNGGFTQRDTTELGAKYVFMKSDSMSWFGELAYQSQDTYSAAAVDGKRDVVPFAKLYTELEYKVNESTKTKFWVEHLPNLKKSKESQSNAELSVSVVMSKVFSLKTAYLYNVNDAIVAPAKKESSKWTTALVASY